MRNVWTPTASIHGDGNKLGEDVALSCWSPETATPSSSSTSSSYSHLSLKLGSPLSIPPDLADSPASSALSTPMFPFNDARDSPPVPSYDYALKHKEFSLLPSLPIDECRTRHLRASKLLTTPESLEIRLVKSASAYPKKARGRKRKVSFYLGDEIVQGDEVSDSSSESESEAKDVKDHKKRRIHKISEVSPALKYMSLFTRSAMAEEEHLYHEKVEALQALDGMVDELQSMQVENENENTCKTEQNGNSFPELRHPQPLSARRKIDLTLLVSSLPSVCPYPPTPRSTILPPIKFSTTIGSPPHSHSPSSSSSLSARFAEELKHSVVEKLGLGSIGLGINSVNLFPTSRNCGTNGARLTHNTRDRMTVVVHTA